MIENGLFVFRCIRCNAMFCLRWRDEKYGEQKRFDALEVNTCSACGKGSVEYVGQVHYVPDETDVYHGS